MTCLGGIKRERVVTIANQAGFSFVELIAVMVLVGIMAAGAGLGISNIITGFMVSRDSAAIAGKAQLAMLRLSREFRVISSVTAATSTSITFVATHEGGINKTYTVTKAGDTITLNDGTTNDTLVDKVSALTYTYYDTFNGTAETSWASSRRLIQITIGMNGPDNTPLSFTTRVTPRNL